jgi:hypothetical protein
MSEKDINTLLELAGKKLNMKPEDLKKELDSGKFDNALKQMSPGDAKKAQTILKNPKLAEQMISSKQAQELYNKLKK